MLETHCPQGRNRNPFGYFLDRIYTAWAKHFQPYQPKAFVFHRIVEFLNDKTWGSAYPTKAFANFLDYLLEHNYQLLTLNQIAADINAGQLTERRRVVGISFDDGSLDIYTRAWPLLKERNLTATIFITTSIIGKRTPPKPWESCGLSMVAMEEEQLIEMDQYGMEIASHGVNHYAMTHLSEGALIKELSESKNCLEKVLGHPIANLSYPHGAFNKKVKLLASIAGYTCAWTCGNEWINPDGDLLQLPRYHVPSQATEKPDFDTLMYDGVLARRFRNIPFRRRYPKDWNVPLPPPELRLDKINL